MPTLSIKHIKTYQYRKPVAFGEHRMMLRPRDGSDRGGGDVIAVGVAISRNCASP
jgi:hypothetical protein